MWMVVHISYAWPCSGTTRPALATRTLEVQKRTCHHCHSPPAAASGFVVLQQQNASVHFNFADLNFRYALKSHLQNARLKLLNDGILSFTSTQWYLSVRPYLK